MKRAILPLLFTLISPPLAAQQAGQANVGPDSLGIQGYDPVSYFNASGPLKGNPAIRAVHEGIVYQFASRENAAAFEARPAQYVPAWGGWCGHAMALRGEKVVINPTCYKIIDGRNVLFYKTVWANALSNWEKELARTPEPQLMGQGDRFWANLLTP